jgi:hypothetical protein
MKYCIDHIERSYTPKQFDRMKTCAYSGAYQGADDRRIRVYCFLEADNAIRHEKEVCPKGKEKS